MNILYIEHYAGSPKMGMEFRPYYLSKEWIKMGNNVCIIAADYSHLRINNPQKKKDFEHEIIDGIDYCWIHTSKYNGNGLSRAKTMAQFVEKLYVKAKQIATNFQPDVIITSSTYPLDTYVGQRIKRYRPSAKLIHEIHDMWPAALTEVFGMSRYHPFVIMMQIAENSFCRHSDYVVSLPPCSKEYLVKHGLDPKKYLSVTNGINVDEWENTEKLNENTALFFQDLKMKGKFIICFFGSITDYYALPELIKAVQLTGNNNIAVVLIGEGEYKEYLKQLASEKMSECFFFLNKIPKKQIPEMLKEVDSLYVGGKANSVFRFGISMNKLFDSMMSGKPILYAVDAPNNYILEYDCGVSVESGNIMELSSGIKKLYNMPQEERTRLGLNGKKAALDYFTYPKLAEKFASVFK